MEGEGRDCGGDLDSQQTLRDGNDGAVFGVKRPNPLTSSTTFCSGRSVCATKSDGFLVVPRN